MYELVLQAPRERQIYGVTAKGERNSIPTHVVLA